MHWTVGVRVSFILRAIGPPPVMSDVRPMQDPRLIILVVVAVGCIAVPISVIFSRRRVWEAWAKVASILVCCFGLGWAGLAFSLIRMAGALSAPTEVLLTRARIFIGGVCLGLILGLVLARPYKKVTDESTQRAV
jgi:hypothetical protein